MEAFLLRVSADLPAAGRFVAAGSVILCVVGGGAFVLGRTAPGRWIQHALGRALELLIATVLLSMVFLSALQILLRNAFDTGLPWIDPLLRHLVLALAFAGAVLATAAKRHVQISVLGRLLRGRGARIGGALVAAAAGVICLWLAHGGLELLAQEIEFEEVIFLGIPAWMVALGFPLVFLVIAFQSFHLLFRELAGDAPPTGSAPEAKWEDPPEVAT